MTSVQHLFMIRVPGDVRCLLMRGVQKCYFTRGLIITSDNVHLMMKKVPRYIKISVCMGFFVLSRRVLWSIVKGRTFRFSGSDEQTLEIH